MRCAALLGPVVASVLLVPGCVELVEDDPGRECPGHWHATFALVTGNRTFTHAISFRDPVFDLSGQTPFRAHMHQAQQVNEWHFEQQGHCVGVQEAMGYLDVHLVEDGFRLDGAHERLGQAGTYSASATTPLQAYIDERGPSGSFAWQEHSMATILDRQLLDGERLLIVLGDVGGDRLSGLQEAVPMPSTRHAP